MACCKRKTAVQKIVDERVKKSATAAKTIVACPHIYGGKKNGSVSGRSFQACGVR